MTDRPDQHPRDAHDDPSRFEDHAIPDDVVDAFLRDTDPVADDDAGQDEESVREFFAFQRAIHALRAPVDTPDQTRQILDAVARRRGWLTSRAQRRVVVGRYAAAGLLLGLCAGALISQRLAPDRLTLVDKPTPVTDFVRSGSQLRADAAGTFDDIGQVLGILPPATPAAPAPDANESSAPHAVDGRRIARVTISDPTELESLTLSGVQPGITILHIIRQGETDPVITAPPRVSLFNPGVESRYTWSGLLAPAADTHEDLLESISR